MAKELPYFQFEPAEYLTKDISFCTLSAQGLFINICAYYWQRQCELSKEQFLKRLNNPIELEELIKEGVIDLVGNVIKIKFLDEQYKKATNFSKEQSRKGSLGGRPKKVIKEESQIKAEIKPEESQIKAIREEEIIKDNIILDVVFVSKINNHNVFTKECLESEYWIEETSRQTKIPKDKIYLALNDFNSHTVSIGEEHKRLKDFKQHFVNWAKRVKQLN